jgi:hypothetical protein
VAATVGRGQAGNLHLEAGKHRSIGPCRFHALFPGRFLVHGLHAIFGGGMGGGCFSGLDMTRSSIEFAVKVFLICLIAVFGWAFFGLMKEIGWI